MNSLKLIRNNFALLFLAVLAVSGVAFLVWAAGANVNCIAGTTNPTCNSTNGVSSTGSSFDADPTDASPNNAVFTNDNDTASIECAGGTYSGGGGNDTFYLRNPQTPAVQAVTINGQGGDDVILDSCFNNTNTLANTLNGDDGNDFIVEDDTGRLYGGNGNDLLAGGRNDDVLGDSNGDGRCTNESDPGDDVFVGGPGTDTYCTAANDGDDIVIIHAGDVPAGNNDEQYTCQGNDTILMFGFNRDGVLTLTTGTQTITDPVNNPTGDPTTGARYTFTATGTCTIIFVE